MNLAPLVAIAPQRIHIYGKRKFQASNFGECRYVRKRSKNVSE
jgi:hypothetical protein